MPLRTTYLRRTAAALLLAAALSIATPAAQSYENLTDLPPSVAVRLSCPKSYGDECPTRVRLKREAIVWGVPLKAGTVAQDWEEDRNGILARDFQYKGAWLKGGTRVHFYSTWGGTLLRDQVLDNIPCRGGTEIAFDTETGHVTECTLSAPHTAAGIAFAAGSKLTFGPNGRLSAAKLTADHRIEERRYSAGLTLFFDGNERLTDVVKVP